MRVLLFTKYPQPGLAKTRLARGVGAENAARLQLAFLRDELRMLSGMGAQVTLCCDPARPLDDYARLFGPAVAYRPQQGADLGQRMLHALHRELEESGEPAVLVGSDLPDLPERHVRDAFAALDQARVCLGPATDGGFYLLGLGGPASPGIFRDVAWSGPQVLARTLDNCAALGLSHRLLPPWPDVDTAEDLAAYAGRNPGRETATMHLIRALGLVKDSWKT